jgi:hypothetical protein
MAKESHGVQAHVVQLTDTIEKSQQPAGMIRQAVRLAGNLAHKGFR